MVSRKRSPARAKVGKIGKRDGDVCVCGSSSTDNMVQCESGSCQIQVYHRSCMGLGEKEKLPEKWMCPACAETLADESATKYKKVPGQQYCVCNGKTTEEMIRCDNISCNIEWFHYTCVKLNPKKLPSKWTCQDCAEPTPAKIEKLLSGSDQTEEAAKDEVNDVDKEVEDEQGVDTREEEKENVDKKVSEEAEREGEEIGGDQEDTKPSTFMCIICLKTYDSREELKAHIITHNTPGATSPMSPSKALGKLGLGRPSGVRGSKRPTYRARMAAAATMKMTKLPTVLRYGVRGGEALFRVAIPSAAMYNPRGRYPEPETTEMKLKRRYRCNICERLFCYSTNLIRHVKEHFDSNLNHLAHLEPDYTAVMAQAPRREMSWDELVEMSDNGKDVGKAFDELAKRSDLDMPEFSASKDDEFDDLGEKRLSQTPRYRASRGGSAGRGRGRGRGRPSNTPATGSRQIEAIVEEDEHGNQRFKCSLCQGWFTDIATLVKHVQQEHPVSRSPAAAMSTPQNSSLIKGGEGRGRPLGSGQQPSRPRGRPPGSKNFQKTPQPPVESSYQIEAFIEQGEDGVKRYRCKLCNALCASVEEVVEHHTLRHGLPSGVTTPPSAALKSISPKPAAAGDVAAVTTGETPMDVVEEASEPISAQATSEVAAQSMEPGLEVVNDNVQPQPAETTLADEPQPPGDEIADEMIDMSQYTQATIDIDMSELSTDHIQMIMQQAAATGANMVVDAAGNKFIMQVQPAAEEVAVAQ